MRAGLELYFLSVPIEHESFARSVQIAHGERDRGIFPKHIFRIDLERGHIGRGELSGDRDLPAKNRGIINSAVQHLGLHVAGDLE